MKKFLLFLFVFISFTSFAQLSVKEGSFHQIDGFTMLDKNEHYDVNNQPMALIKISTVNINEHERTRITFKGNLATEFDVRFEPSEIYLYLSTSATFIEIHHPDYSKTEFRLPYDLKPFCGYEMVLVNGEDNEPKYNYLIIMTDQDNASIYIDDEYIGDKEVSKTLKVGTTHAWRIECDLYKTETGEFTIKAGDPMIVEKKLKPEFGYISVDSKPESDAMVYIDNKKVGKTPYKSDKIKCGMHKVKIMKDMFGSVEQTFEVIEGKTTEAILTMNSNCVNVTINTDSRSEIWVDNEYKNNGNWTGCLSEGEHYFVAKKDKHKSSTQKINLVMGNDQTIELESPKPIYGYLDISTIPMKADVYIDGEHYGQTPRIITDLLIGEYELVLKMEGYKDVKKQINIEESKMTVHKETLVMGSDIPDMKPTEVVMTSWKDKPINIATFNTAFSFSKPMHYSFGLTYGRVKKWGWYVSASSNFRFKALGGEMINTNYSNMPQPWVGPQLYTGKTSLSRLSVIGGVMWRVAEPLVIKCGIGYGSSMYAWEKTNEEWVLLEGASYKLMDINCGVHFVIKKVNFSIDLITTCDSGSYSHHLLGELKFGIGYNF